MSTNAEAGPSKKRRQYASRACNGCRRRRCKCDGVQPVCGTCANTGHECSWSLEGDARRPATKQLVESLRVKIQVLESEIAVLKAHPNQLGNPSSTSTLASSSSRSPPNPDDPNYVVPITRIPDELRAILPDGVLPSTSTTSGLAQTSDPTLAERPLPAPTAQFTSTALYRYIFQIDQSIQTSEQPTDVRLSLVCDWNRYLPDLSPEHMSREEHDTILARGFKYGTSWLLGLVPELFLHDMLFALSSPSSSSSTSPSSSASTSTSQNSPTSGSQTKLHHYTPLLHCAFLAFACAFAPSRGLRTRAIRAKFAARAKRWLDDEFKRPVMSLVRSLALLAEYHCGIGERDTGYMYMGMSIRAARALIASPGKESWVNQGMVAYPDSIARDWHFWSTFAQDKLMALEYGRPYDVPIPHMGVSLPCIDTELDALPWPAETEPFAQGEQSTDTSSIGGGEGYDHLPASPGQGKATTAAFLESCKLTIIATRILDFLGAGGAQGGKSPEEGALINLHLQLDTWFNNLPASFLVWARSSSPLPHVIVLHICYWSLLIYLHQPFYTLAQTKPTRVPVGDLSVKMCDRASHKIVQLVGMYDVHYGLRFFPRNMVEAIYTSGVALLRELSNAPSGAVKKRATAHQSAVTCVRALRAIGETWSCAARRADALETLIGDTGGEDLAGTDMDVDELEHDTDEHVPLSTSLAAGSHYQVEPRPRLRPQTPYEGGSQPEFEAPDERDDRYEHEASRFESEDRYEPAGPQTASGSSARTGAEGSVDTRGPLPGAERGASIESEGRGTFTGSSHFQQVRARNLTMKIMAYAAPSFSRGGEGGGSGDRRSESRQGDRAQSGRFSLGKRKASGMDGDDSRDMGFLKAFSVSWVV